MALIDMAAARASRCDLCDGTGRIGDDIPCPRCDGAGDAPESAPVLPPCGTCCGALVPGSVDPAMAGWCESCQTWGIGALELERHTQGYGFWDRFESEFSAADPAQVRAVVVVPADRFPVASAADDARTKTIAEFLIHLGASGVHLAEWAGGGVEPRVSSELARERLSEVIAAFISRA